MKRKPIFQFSLTTIVSMLLVACGGSSGNDQPTTQVTPTPVVQQPTESVTEQPKAEEKKEEAKVENPDQQTLSDVPAETAFLGYKHVNKNNSNFKINMESGANGADKPVGMNVENPNRSFDTLVVAEPVSQNPDEPAKVGYLEDFDFRKNNMNDTRYNFFGTIETNLVNSNEQPITKFLSHTQLGTVKFKTPLHVAQSSTVFQEDGTHNPATTLVRDDGNGVNSKQGINATKTGYTGSVENVEALLYAGNDISASTEIRRSGSILFENYTDTHFAAGTEMVALYRENAKLKQNADGTYSIAGAFAKTNATAKVEEVLVGVANDSLGTDFVKGGAVLAGSNSRSQGVRVGGFANYDKQVSGQESDKVATSNNVAEVYGYRTFASSDQYTGKVTDRNLPNLPLENKQLKHVQYGRVTTHLSDQTSFDEFRKGVLDNEKIQSYVVDYGYFGQDGTEDHYFYRGVDGTTPEQLKALQAKGGILKYWGHAVSYGLNNKYSGDGSSNSAPTAIGGNHSNKFVSGNHVHAWVDLTSNKVGGAIYNTWFVPTAEDQYKGHLKPVDLVTFEGTLSANGNIAGTSKLTYEDSAGVFGANLYGANATEMGGVVASNDKTEKGKWGAVFGAIVPNSGEIQNATNRGLGQ